MRRIMSSMLTAAATFLVSSTTCAADDRALCGQAGLDLRCSLIGPGFTVVPPVGPETVYFATFRKPSGPSRGAVYGRGGWLQTWGVPASPFQEVSWAGSTHTFQVHGAPGTVAVAGVLDGSVQSAYLDLSRGDGFGFVANLDHVAIGPRTTLEVHFAKAPQTVVDVVGAGKFGDTLRLIVDKPFVTRRTGGGRTCLFWDQLDAVCLEGWPSKPFPVAVDRSGSIASVLNAGRNADRARWMTPNLPAIAKRQGNLPFIPF
jgi:hypothetical protein